PKAPVNLLRALSHAGDFVVGAFRDTQLVGISLGFFGLVDSELHLHSHITGVDRAFQGKSLGFALKQFQRSWSLERGARVIEWTADPLVRANVFFNLAKLGATIVAYHENFYGLLQDGLNGTSESDRVVIRWDLTSARSTRAADGAHDSAAPPDGHIVLRPGDDGAPQSDAGDGDVLLAWVPQDIVRLRESDVRLAGLWRRALRGDRAEASRRLPCGDDHPRRVARADAMKLREVELRRIHLPLVAPFRASIGTLDLRDVLLVHVVGDDGEGWGECSAFGEPFYSYEYTDGAHDVIRRHVLPRLFAQRDVAAEDISRILAPVRGHPMAKAAVEMAVLDAEL